MIRVQVYVLVKYSLYFSSVFLYQNMVISDIWVEIIIPDMSVIEAYIIY